MVELKIGTQRTTHETLSGAVQAHNAARDASGKGVSTWPRAEVRMSDGTRYHISYNGRVWDRPVSDMDAREVSCCEGK